MSRDLIRLMHALFLPYATPLERLTALSGEQTPADHETPWRPNTDVLRTPDGWLIKFELAGTRPEDIDLEVLAGRMTLRGVRRDQCAPQGGVYYQMEIAYSRFERALELPCDLKRAEITTDYKDGLLYVHVHTAPEHHEEGRA